MSRGYLIEFTVLKLAVEFYEIKLYDIDGWEVT